MPRRNLIVITLLFALAVLCNAKAQNGRYVSAVSDAMQAIRQRYIVNVPPRKLYDAAMDGMMSELKDPHSVFFSADDYRRFREDTIDRQFEGIGIQLELQAELPRIQRVIFGGPAFNRGLMAGDIIRKIDDAETKGLSQEEVIRRIRNRPGSLVRLAIERDGSANLLNFEIERDIVKTDSVIGYSRSPEGEWSYSLDADKRIAYVRLLTFSQKTVGELKAALGQMESNHKTALILDLRDNGGGLLESAEDVCSLFLKDDELIVSVRDKNGQARDERRANGGPHFRGFPIVILVNDNSASASEIMAACMQDHKVAAIAGEQSYGKGTVQTVIDLQGGQSAIKLTTATFWRPSNQNINRTEENQADKKAWGVRPDEGLAVKLTREQAIAIEKARQARDRADRRLADPKAAPPADVKDPQLDKAVEWLQQELQKRAGETKNAA